MVVAARDDAGRLMGLAPLFALPGEGDGEKRMLGTIGCVDVSDYLDWILCRGNEEQVATVLLDVLAGEPTDAWHVLSLCNIPDDSPTLELLPRLSDERGWQVSHAVEDVVPVLRLPASWEAYEQGLPGKQRRELRRKLRKAGPYSDIDWYIVGPQHDLVEEISAFVDLLVMSHPEKAGFMDQRNRDFFQAIGQAAHDGGYLQLAFLTFEGRRIASYMNFTYGDRVMVYNSGLDPGAYRLSPGIVLMAHLIRHAIEAGQFALFDFLRGGESYKYDLGGRDSYVHRLTITRA
jgi:hypothetical protein